MIIFEADGPRRRKSTFWEEYHWLRHVGIKMARAAFIAARRTWYVHRARRARKERAKSHEWD
jgi:hypothetical protein